MTNLCMQLSVLFSVLQDEIALCDAAKRGDVPAVRRLLVHVNVDCTPYQVLLCPYCVILNSV